jgi:hypothetical protein
LQTRHFAIMTFHELANWQLSNRSNMPAWPHEICQHDISPTRQFANMTIRQQDNSLCVAFFCGQIFFFLTVFYSSSDASLAEILFIYDTQSKILAPFRWLWGSRIRTRDSCVLCLVSPSCLS